MTPDELVAGLRDLLDAWGGQSVRVSWGPVLRPRTSLTLWRSPRGGISVQGYIQPGEDFSADLEIVP